MNGKKRPLDRFRFALNCDHERLLDVGEEEGFFAGCGVVASRPSASCWESSISSSSSVSVAVRLTGGGVMLLEA